MDKCTWTSADIVKATGGRLVNGDFVASGVSIDTRTLTPAELFVALKDARDGHDFVENAMATGAAGALVSREVGGGPQVVVEDVLVALERMAAFARDRSPAQRVAVTGSVGKTSVKDMLAQIFSAVGAAHWPEKSFNNHYGVPLTLARMPEVRERAVFEIGMSTPGEIAPRSRLVSPHHAMITKIAPAHLEGLGSIEAVADEKADIFAGVQDGGSIIVPADDRFTDRLIQRGKSHVPSAEVLSFGTADGATAKVTGYESDGTASKVHVALDGRPAAVSLNAVGDHWTGNVAAALLVAWRTGIAPHIAAEALSGFAPPPGRGTAEILVLPDGSHALLIDDAYNANPESMRAAIAALSVRPGGRKLAALGEMLEMGAGSEAGHAGLAPQLEAVDVDQAFLAGKAMAPLAAALSNRMDCHHAETAGPLEDTVKNALRTGDTLLIKGSNASGMGMLVKALRQWSDANRARVMNKEPRAPQGA
ncbi:MAG: UDP-N-acetylmuramoyl-tripeptide--D-alanyl-D-alanine ligase [Pseudomonadota bacterium]